MDEDLGGGGEGEFFIARWVFEYANLELVREVDGGRSRSERSEMVVEKEVFRGSICCGLGSLRWRHFAQSELFGRERAAEERNRPWGEKCTYVPFDFCRGGDFQGRS